MKGKNSVVFQKTLKKLNEVVTGEFLYKSYRFIYLLHIKEYVKYCASYCLRVVFRKLICLFNCIHMLNYLIRKSGIILIIIRCSGLDFKPYHS